MVIAVDTSALMEIVPDAPLAEACSAVLESADDASMSTGALAEALIVAGRRGVARGGGAGPPALRGARLPRRPGLRLGLAALRARRAGIEVQVP